MCVYVRLAKRLYSSLKFKWMCIHWMEPMVIEKKGKIYQIPLFIIQTSKIHRTQDHRHTKILSNIQFCRKYPFEPQRISKAIHLKKYRASAATSYDCGNHSIWTVNRLDRIKNIFREIRTNPDQNCSIYSSASCSFSCATTQWLCICDFTSCVLCVEVTRWKITYLKILLNYKYT